MNLKHNHTKILLALLLLAITIPSRIIQNNQVFNIDEPWWVISSSNFYYAFAQRDFENTYFEYHPGVTNMWIFSTALHFYFPEYRGMGQGFFDQRKPHFEEFFRENGKEVIDFARNSRYIQAAVLAGLTLLAFYLLSLLIGDIAAFVSLSLVNISPFFLGHSRLMNMETMLAMFVLVSILGMQVYLNKDRKLIYLIISGVAFGLAQLTKSPSIVVVGVVGFMLLVNLFRKNENTFKNKFFDALKIFVIWIMSAVLVYFILWPGMWVNPARMLGEVYGNAFSYAFQGGRLDVTEELQPAQFALESRFDGLQLYLTYWFSGTTFITWLGIIFASILLFSTYNEENLKTAKLLSLYLLVLGSLFILMFGLAQGRNHAHYIMSSFVAFDVIAGIGWGFVWLLVQSKWHVFNRVYASIIFIVALVLTQIGFGLPYAPYYFTYKNPLAKQPATFGYGEGYNLAAEYLNSKPNAQEIKAYVYNGMGTFSYFFSGETLIFKRAYLVDESYEQIVEEIKSSDYLVLYPIIRARQPETEKLFTAFENVTPEKTFVIYGMEYVYIYNVSEIPESVYEALLNRPLSFFFKPSKMPHLLKQPSP
jgi:hypothetical protein